MAVDAASREHTGAAGATLVVAVIAFAVQQTSIVPAVHDVEQSLHGTDEWASWLVTVYLIVATVATPALGRLADLYGRRRMLLIGLAVFALASVGAALSPNLVVLLCFRALQGAGGAVYPLALALARQTVPKGRANAVISLLSGAFGTGTAIGFVGGGLLAQYVTWRAIFAVGAGLVALAAVLVLRCVSDRTERAGGRFDLLGTVVLGVSAIALLAGVTVVVSAGWRSPLTIGLLVVAVVGAALWVRHERRSEDPLVDLGVLRTRSVAAANLATIGLGWALFGSYLLIPHFARVDPGRTGYGLAAHSAVVGLAMLPLAVGQMVGGPVAGWVSRQVPARLVFAGGLLFVAAGLVLLAFVHGGVPLVAVGTLVLGVGAGTALQAGSAVATEGVPADVAAVSASVNSTVRRLAGGIGGQVNTILLAVATAGFAVYQAG
ncbi:MAG TPA: MFS transporter, partial [Pseudonocardiaceae bacterium]|nr:MFS transporter [Pseudonocardiaceae bacterium]